MKLFNLLQENGPEILIGREIKAYGSTYKIMAMLAVGGAMFVYELENIASGQRDQVLKVPREKPGSENYQKVINGYRLAIERLIPIGLGVRTVVVEIDGSPVFIQERIIPLDKYLQMLQRK